jgi:TRAP-type C4-dicarboxylate transport system permease small subunit
LIQADNAERAAGPGRVARRTSASATMTIRLALRWLLRDVPRAAVGVVILLAIAINFANIIGRYVFLAPLPWAEEVLVFLVIWGVCLGASAVTYDNRHLDMDLFVVRFPPKLRAALEALQLAVLVGLCAFTAVNAWTIVAVMARNGQVSITAGVPMTIPYAAFVTGFALIAVAAVAGAVERRLERVSRPAFSPER